MHRFVFLATFLAIVFAGCSPLRQAASERSAARVYNESSDKTFDAALAALQSEGFKIAVADKQRGVIESEPSVIDAQTANALFDEGLTSATRGVFAVRCLILPQSNVKSELSVEVLSDEKSNGILEQTLLNAVAAKLSGGEAQTLYRLVDVSKAPFVSVSLKDGSTIEGYLLDGGNKEYLRLKLKSGGIMHIERSDVAGYSLASEQGSSQN
ncbi:MAG: hypothetical protein NZM06_01020 [Chloroherpetonaceae bacterium]|nr:hypothetical protein [Chloroherpetonaceae bacterium]MDW8438399.1 hypothetical protein [Chloroherpetonaceae bacterium]